MGLRVVCFPNTHHTSDWAANSQCAVFRAVQGSLGMMCVISRIAAVMSMTILSSLLHFFALREPYDLNETRFPLQQGPE